MRTYQIESASGDAVKVGWEEINCDFIELDGTLIKFFSEDPQNIDEFGDPVIRMIICYNLAPGEALLFVGED